MDGYYNAREHSDSQGKNKEAPLLGDSISRLGYHRRMSTVSDRIPGWALRIREEQLEAREQAAG